jgi:hypothetical protein
MTSKDWRDLARVYRAGAAEYRALTFKVDRAEQACVLDAQAQMCETVAGEREAAQRLYAAHHARVKGGLS